ncbi:MAG: hypothetical protein AAFR00_12810 [Pseudomonadota bacterium]
MSGFRALSTASLLAIATACAAVPNPVGALTSQEPASQAAEVDPVPGTVFVYNDGRVERFLRREDDSLVWATRAGREYKRAANPALPILSWDIGQRSGRREVFGNADAIWPPASGARARFRVLSEVSDGERRRRMSQAWSCAVDGPETESVPAGDFGIYKITCERFSVNSMRLLEQRTWWWSEDVGHYVRRRFQSLRDGEVSDIALCASLPELRASEARIEALLEDC